MKSKYRVSGSTAVALLLLCAGLNWTTTNVKAQENETIEGSITAQRGILIGTTVIVAGFMILVIVITAVIGLLVNLEAEILRVTPDTLIGLVEARLESIADAVAAFMAGDSGFAELIYSMCACG